MALQNGMWEFDLVILTYRLPRICLRVFNVPLGIEKQRLVDVNTSSTVPFSKHSTMRFDSTRVHITKNTSLDTSLSP